MTRKQIFMQEVKRNPLHTVLAILLIPAAYYAILMASLILSFNNFPNYVTFYDWIGNSAEILRSTPSFTDAATIVSEEWLIEIGYMNYDYGFGISEWSLNIMPFKVLLVMFLAVLLLLNYRLFRFCKTNASCAASKSSLKTSIATTGVGSVLVGAASMTMFWVVCCASPTWVVGLAMLGLVSVSTALALDPLETSVLMLGYAFLLAGSYLLLKNAQQLVSQNEQLETEPSSSLGGTAHA